jgi:hypothetical protein
MGEVNVAQDRQLERTIDLKILPENFLLRPAADASFRSGGKNRDDFTQSEHCAYQ